MAIQFAGLSTPARFAFQLARIHPTRLLVLLGWCALAVVGAHAADSKRLTLHLNLPSGVVGVTYAGLVSASGGVPPYNFAIGDGALPQGLALDSATGAVAGMPSLVGANSFSVRVTDSQTRVARRTALTISSGSGSSITVHISPATATLPSSGVQQFAATVEGTSNTAVTWSATQGSVSTSGLYTAPKVNGTTTVTVTATSAADTSKQSSALVTVSSQPVGLSITTTSIPSAQSGTAYSSLISASGGTTPYQWNMASGNLPQGFTLSGGGQLGGTTAQTGQFSFTVQVTDASSSTATQALSLAVLSVPPTGSGFDGPAELPRVYLQSTLANTPAPGATTLVSGAGNLQNALNNANCGDTIQLAAGASFTGVFTLPAKACDNQHWIIVRTSAPDTALPPEGTRLTPCYAGVPSLPGRPSLICISRQNVLAQIIDPKGPGSGPIVFASGANHYRLLGLEITRAAGTGAVADLVSPKGTADNIVIDRSWIHGTAQDETGRGVRLSGTTSFSIVDSYFSDFHCISVTGTCTDSQAIVGGSGGGGGPYKIVNNFLEAAAENILFGGGAATATPADIEIRRNHLFKPAQWQASAPGFVGGANGSAFLVKNHFELKNAQRVLFEGNVLERTWGGFSQSGFSILLTPKNQFTPSGVSVCPICQVTDITIRYNTISHVGAGLQIATSLSGNGTNGAPALAGARFSFHDLTIDDVSGSNYKGSGTLILMLNNWPANVLNTVTINHITGFPDANSKLLSLENLTTLPTMTGLVFTNNLVMTGRYPVWSAGGGPTNCAYSDIPVQSVSTCFKPYSFADNALIATPPAFPPSVWPSSNYFPVSTAAVQFVNFNNGNGGNYQLLPSSPYKNAASDGKDVGADISLVQAATAGVY